MDFGDLCDLRVKHFLPLPSHAHTKLPCELAGACMDKIVLCRPCRVHIALDQRVPLTRKSYRGSHFWKQQSYWSRPQHPGSTLLFYQPFDNPCAYGVSAELPWAPAGHFHPIRHLKHHSAFQVSASRICDDVLGLRLYLWTAHWLQSLRLSIFLMGIHASLHVNKIDAAEPYRWLYRSICAQHILPGAL